jgi:hypothetical protein
MIMGGFPKLGGATLAERIADMKANHDWVRRVAMNEPRGHRDMFGGVLMDPIDPSADIAVFFIEGGQYYNMCGHASLGTGFNELVVDPADPVRYGFTLQVSAIAVRQTPLKPTVRSAMSMVVTLICMMFPTTAAMPLEKPEMNDVIGALPPPVAKVGSI